MKATLDRIEIAVRRDRRADPRAVRRALIEIGVARALAERGVLGQSDAERMASEAVGRLASSYMARDVARRVRASKRRLSLKTYAARVGMSLG